ncbi:MAG TPA: beta-galactosidase GalA [Candidatus Angelobacter sp.]|nr:beta-galactosidase GalA [Candidatus Angelobacter sp.]
MKFTSLAVKLAAIFLMVAAARAAESPRERTSIDFGWKFHLGDDWPNALHLDKAGSSGGPASASFGDATWRTVNLPHDWAVELPFDSSADGGHGFKPVGPGFPHNSVAWYRRKFDLPKEDAGQRLWLEFDGVFRDAEVFVNGWYIGHHESGYSSFRFDITDVANYGGNNVISVRVDASKFEGWFYEGEGIYRHVWLVKTAPVAIAPDGIFVYSKFKTAVPKGPAEIHVQTELGNWRTNAAKAMVRCEILSPSGKVLATMHRETTVPAPGFSEVEQTTRVAHPELWSPESPKLYRLVTTIESNGKIVDRKETEFGIRTIAFDPDRGFLLNGEHYELKGTCNHQDMAGVGAALPDALQYFRIAKLKEFGCNAYRTSHNAPTPELLEACDRLGMIVMDENRLLGSDAQNMARWNGQIRRDRNHASVCIWSLANEEFSVQDSPQAASVARTMQDFVRRLDPTRPVTYASPEGDVFMGVNSVIQVRGWNYHVGSDMDKYHAEHPTQPEVGTEQGSTVSTRGIYTNDATRGYVSAYDDNAPSWATTAERWWGYFQPRPWLSGGFVWTGFDYRGEPTPYSWPCINSHFGILDTCGFPKDNFYYYQAWWTDKPMVHLLPHWNWPGREGQEIDVRALSNCEEVELFLNGQSLGRKTMKRNSELKWMVKYAPGILSAKGFNGGKVVAETKVETTGEPASVQLAANRSSIKADGRDVSVITVSVTDSEGRVVPVASNKIHFQLDGPGKIIGVGNGDPSCHEPDQFIAATPFHTRPVAGWRWKRVANVYAANLPETAEICDDSTWQSADVNSDSGPLQNEDRAVFRAQFNVTPEDLNAVSIDMDFERIDEDGTIYINGQRAGESHNWADPASVDVKRFLHAGTNSVAVAVQNWNGPGGVNKGVLLQFGEKPAPVDWQRSVFNGLAEVIVQSEKEPGEIKLTATSDGLKAGEVQLNTAP